MCTVAPTCRYAGSCTCVGGAFQCTYTDCGTPMCDATDPDPAAVTYRVTTVGLGQGAGFNLDGVNNAPPPAGSSATVAGCGAVDATGGIDDALPGLASAWSDVVDVPAALGDLAALASADAGAPSGTGIEITVDHLATPEVANDPCVLVHLTLHPPGASAITVDAVGHVINRVFEGTFTSPLPLDLPLGDRLAPASCVGGVCASAHLRLMLERARIRLVLGATSEALGANSVISGVVFVSDPDASYAARNASGLAGGLETFAAQAGLLPSLAPTLVSAAQDAADLHQENDGTISVCQGASVASTNANALSVSVALLGVSP